MTSSIRSFSPSQGYLLKSLAVDSIFSVTGIPKPKDAQWIRHNRPEDGKKIPYVQHIPVRYEITAWFKDICDSEDGSELKKQWTLFILGLAKFKALEIKDKLSYFQIAGIHGFPLQSWDGALAPDNSGSKPGDNPEAGYCHHNTVTFPTWHRPYLMLYEQCIWRNMKELLDEKDNSDFSKPFKGLSEIEKEKWNAAADHWRLPYWDWARKQTNLKGQDKYAYPIICTVPEVQVWLPNRDTAREKDLYQNPLEKFECPEKDRSTDKPVKFGEVSEVKYRISDDERPNKIGGDTLPWGQCTATSRYGILKGGPGEAVYAGLDGAVASERGNFAIAQGTENFDYIKPGHDKEIPPDIEKPSSLGDAVIRMFSENYVNTWGEFASTKWYKEEAATITTGYMSLEYIHNNLHNLAGGSRMQQKSATDKSYGLGHMSEVPVAAFDPIFWLHHANIDRLCAIWQTLYWEKWWDKPEPLPGHPTDYKRVPDKRPDEALEPFHRGINDQGQVISWTSHACRDWTVGGYTYDDLIPAEAVLESKDGPLDEDLYKQALRVRIQQMYYSIPDMVRELYLKADPITIFGHDVASRSNETFQDYLVNVVYDRYALNGLSYSIRFYLSRHTQRNFEAADIEDDESNFVGEIYSFGGNIPAVGKYSGCNNCAHQQATGLLSKAQLPITAPLLLLAQANQLGDSRKINRRNIVPFLKQNLFWRYVGPGGIEMGEENFPQTSILVYAGLSQSVPVGTTDTHSSFLHTGNKAVYSTPLFGIDQAHYTPLFDATKVRRSRLSPRSDSLVYSFTSLSAQPEVQYSEEEW